MKKIPNIGIKSYIVRNDDGTIYAAHPMTIKFDFSENSRIFSEERAKELLSIEEWIEEELSKEQFKLLFKEAK